MKPTTERAAAAPPPACEFQPGDIVALKSGGPPMTVARVTPAGLLVEALWFKESELFEGRFAPGVLRRVESGKDEK
jgi:uncharacterized protein YodC (DUF2158 family)